MRNLKRALSLGLTAAMISGLMVMGSSAAGYADVTSEQNEEAIEVLQTIGIMIGDESGNFNPDQNVTRNQMAVIMANLMEYNVATYKDTSPFTDVPAWAEPYVAACYTNGITTGYSATIYGGSDTVTTAQAALMLMKALGYFQYASDFGNDWQLAATKQANDIDLLVGVDSGVKDPMTRNDVAQLVLNTLRSGTVKAETDGNWTIGNVTITNNVKYSYVTSNQSYATAISDVRSTSNTTDAGRSIVELGEQLYMGDLKLNDNAIDDFGRPSRNWNYEGKEIGTYAKTELLKATYTTAVTGREMYDLLTASTINDNDLARYVDGFGVGMDKTDLSRNNKSDLAYTGNGALTEVYLDDDNDEITIATINTYLAQATGDYSEEKEYAPLEVYLGLNNDSHVYNVDVADVEAVADVADEEFYLVNISYADANSLDDDRNAMVAEIASPEVMENSTVTKWSDSATNVVKKLTVDGTEYNAAVKAFYDEDTLEAYDNDLLTDMSYNLYLDQYGYVIGVDVYEGDLKYVFITGYDRNSSNLSVSTADAGAIFLDGTMDEIKVNVKATNENIEDYVADAENEGRGNYIDADGNPLVWQSNGALGGNPILNTWYRYSVNEAGVYTLKPVSMTATRYDDQLADGSYEDVTINTANVSVKDNVANAPTRVYGEDESVYITVDTDRVDTTGNWEIAITDVDGVYTGVQNVNLEIDTTVDVLENPGVEAQVYTVYDKDNYIIGAVVIGDVSGSGDYAYILSNGATSEEKIGDTYYWEFDAILDGQVQTLTAKSKYTEIINTIAANQFEPLELRFDTDDYVVRVLEPEAEDVYDYFDAIDLGGKEPDITDFEVYYIDSNDNADPATAGYDYLELNLQGRTLYITDDQDDYGLAMASDAKAVVIQDEYNKTDVKTEFTTVKAAIAHLADPVDQSTDLEYNGKIFAVLNTNGSAAWIVFDSRTKLTTGNGGIHGDDADWSVYNNKDINATLYVEKFGDWFKATDVNINRLGNLAYSFTVPAAMDVTSYDWWVEVNGEVVDGGTAIKGDGTYVQHNGTLTDTITGKAGWVSYDTGDRVEVYVENINWGGMPVVGDVENPALPPLDVTFDGADEGDAIPGADIGDVITIIIKNQAAAKAVALASTETVTTPLAEGETYMVTVNGTVTGPWTFQKGEMKVEYPLTADDVYSGKIVVTDITLADDSEEPTPDPDAEPIESVELTFSTEGLEIGDTLPVASTETANIAKVETVWTNAAGEVVTSIDAAGTYTYTITVTADEGYTVADAEYNIALTGNVTVDKPAQSDAEGIKASIVSTTITMYSYKGTSLADAKYDNAVKQAIINALNLDLGLNDVTITGNNVIANGTLYSFATGDGSRATPKDQVKVTAGDKTVYAEKSSTAAITGLPNGKYLMADVLADDSAITVSGGSVASVDLNKADVYDFTLVEALELKTLGLGITATADDISLTTAGNKFVQVGAALKLEKGSLTEGTVVLFSVNGTVISATANKDGKATVETTVVKDAAGSADLVINEAAGMAYVYVDGKQMTNAYGSELFKEGDVVALDTSKSYIKSVSGKMSGTALTLRTDAGGYQISTSDLTGTTRIDLYTASKYAASEAVKANSTKVMKNDGSKTFEAITAGDLIAVGATVQVTADDTYTVLESVSSNFALAVTEGSEPGATAGVWTFTMPVAEVKAEDIDVAYSVDNTDFTSDVSADALKDANKTVTAKITGENLTTDLDVEYEWTTQIAGIYVKSVEITGGELVITLESRETPAADAAATAKLNVKIGDLSFDVTFATTAP